MYVHGGLGAALVTCHDLGVLRLGSLVAQVRVLLRCPALSVEAAALQQAATHAVEQGHLEASASPPQRWPRARRMPHVHTRGGRSGSACWASMGFLTVTDIQPRQCQFVCEEGGASPQQLARRAAGVARARMRSSGARGLALARGACVAGRGRANERRATGGGVGGGSPRAEAPVSTRSVVGGVLPAGRDGERPPLQALGRRPRLAVSSAPCVGVGVSVGARTHAHVRMAGGAARIAAAAWGARPDHREGHRRAHGEGPGQFMATVKKPPLS